jgi:NitT/TauT family transport system permease protein
MSRFRVRALYLMAMLACMAVWEFAYRVGILSPIIFGAPSLIAEAIRVDGAKFWDAMQVTTFEVVIAIIISWSVGIAFGVLAGAIRFIGRVSAPFLSAIIAVPIVVLYPILMAWFGIGPESKVAFGVLLGTFPIALNTMLGVQAIEQGYMTMARAMGANRLQSVARVMVPLALPSVISGLRLGTSLVIAGVVLTEMLASTNGLGFLITYNRTIFNTGQVYLGIALALVLTAAANAALSYIERRLGRWRALQQEAG